MNVVGKGNSGEVVIVVKDGIQYAKKTLSNTNTGLNGFLEALFLYGNDNEYIGSAEIIEFDDREKKLYLYLPLAKSSASIFSKKNIKLSVEYMKNITIQLLLGLEYIHSFNVVHRDIKPSNILVFEKENGSVFKIIDFDLSIQSSSVKGEAYTIYYKAPETWDKEYNFKADIWALGCTLYEIYHRRILFPLKGPSSKNRIYDQGIKILNSSEDEFDIFLQKLINLNPVKRKNAFEILQDEFLNFRKVDSCINEYSSLEHETTPDVVAERLYKILFKNTNLDEKIIFCGSRIVALKISGKKIDLSLLSSISSEDLYLVEKNIVLLAGSMKKNIFD